MILCCKDRRAMYTIKKQDSWRCCTSSHPARRLSRQVRVTSAPVPIVEISLHPSRDRWELTVVAKGERCTYEFVLGISSSRVRYCQSPAEEASFVVADILMLARFAFATNMFEALCPPRMMLWWRNHCLTSNGALKLLEDPTLLVRLFSAWP